MVNSLENLPGQVETLRVELAENPYPIFVGSQWWEQIAATCCSQLPRFSHAVIIGDAAIQTPWIDSFAQRLSEQGLRLTRLQVASGESSKSVAELANLWEAMLADHTDRYSVIFAIGGGVVGDLAGMAAATFHRGLRLVQIPTTLLSQVDSSVGGKTGINLPTAKNAVGAFWQPALVAIDTATLGTLPKRTFVSGFAEVVKYGVIADAHFFTWLEDHAGQLIATEPKTLRHAILASCRTKAEVVVADERETTGRRATLNYGHTFAHAIEALAGYGKFLHGEAVAIGMRMAAELACLLGRVDQPFVDRQTELLERLTLPTTWHEADPKTMQQAMRGDKKVAEGKIRFVLPSSMGHVELVESVPESDVREAIQRASR